MWRAWSWGNIYIDFDITSTNYTARFQADMLTHSVETIVGVCWLRIQCIPALKYMYIYSHSYFGKAGYMRSRVPIMCPKMHSVLGFPLHKVTPPPAQSSLPPSGRHHVFSYPWTNRKTLQLPQDRQKNCKHSG